VRPFDLTAWCHVTRRDHTYDHEVLFPAVRHELSFWHGTRRLTGDLVRPEGTGPHPVILVVGESGATHRDRSAWLDGLAAAGIACFTWDRAGSTEPALDVLRRAADQAREVLAAVERLRCLPELDGDAVALLGWGEGGWAATQAATFSSRVRALVLAGTPTVAPCVRVEHEVVQYLRTAGHTGPDVAAARGVVRLRLAGVSEGDPAGGIDALTARYRCEPWFPTLLTLEAFTAPCPDHLAADPLPTLSAVDVPVLALLGEQDPTLPVDDSVRGVREALRGAGHGDHRVAVVRGADRGLRVRPRHGLGHLVDGRHQFGEWPDGLTQLIVEWLDERIRRAAEVPAYAPPVAGDHEAFEARLRWSSLDRPAPDGSRSDRPGPLPIRQVRRRIHR
jgi:hypothetical protein